MTSKLQLLKSLIDCHSAVRFLQRKFNLEGFSYRRICGDDNEFDSLLEAKIPEREKMEGDNEVFHLSDISSNENADSRMKVVIPQQGSTAQQNNLEAFDQRKRPCKDNQESTSGVLIEPTQTKTVQKLQLESKPKGFPESKRARIENSNSSLEDRQLANTKTVCKEQLQSKPEGFLDSESACHENSNSVSEFRKSAKSMTAQQKILELKSEGFFEIKISRDEYQDLSSEVGETRHSKRVQQENLELKPHGFPYTKRSSEDHNLSFEDGKPVKTKTFLKEQLESKLKGLDFDSKSCCDENSDFSSEITKPRHTRYVQPNDLEFKPESFHSNKGPCHGTQDPSSEVRKPQHMKTIRPKGLEFKPESVQSSKNYCHQSQNSSLEVIKPLRAEAVQQKSLELKTEGVQSSSSSSLKNSNHSSGGKKPRCAKTVYKKNKGLRYCQLPCDSDIQVKKEPPKKIPVDKAKMTPVHREACRVPSWQNDEMARAKLSQRRTAVCDNIERQLTNQSGISLRKLRKYLVVEAILKEVNLL